MKLMDRDNILARKTGRRRLFEHTRDQGEQMETLWESGKTIRHLRHSKKGKIPGKRGEVSEFQNKTGNDETRHETERKS